MTGLARWIGEGRPVQTLVQTAARELGAIGGITLIDVRDRSEHLNGSIPGAVSIPLHQLQWRMNEIDPNTTVVVHCKGGYRSSVASNLLQAAGLQRVVNLSGGYDAWQDETRRPAVGR
jgi:hydroxyacylglutathione hydrolase